MTYQSLDRDYANYLLDLFFFCGIVLCLKERDTMTALEDFYFGNIIPSEYRQKKDTKKKLSEMTNLLDELKVY